MNVPHSFSDAPEVYNSAELELAHDPRGFPPQAVTEESTEAIHRSSRDMNSGEIGALKESIPDSFLKRWKWWWIALFCTIIIAAIIGGTIGGIQESRSRFAINE